MNKQGFSFFFLFIFVFMCFCPAFSQSSNQELNAIYSRIEKGFSISFFYEVVGKEGQILNKGEKVGTLFVKGEKFKLDYEGLRMVYDGRELSYFNEEENTFTRLIPTQEELLEINPFYSFLDSNKYEIREERCDKDVKIYLFPRDRKSYNMEFLFKSTKIFPEKLIVVAEEGIILEFNINKAEELGDLKIKFEQSHTEFPNSELIDLR